MTMITITKDFVVTKDEPKNKKSESRVSLVSLGAVN